jgi:hypothetical protein
MVVIIVAESYSMQRIDFGCLLKYFVMLTQLCLVDQLDLTREACHSPTQVHALKKVTALNIMETKTATVQHLISTTAAIFTLVYPIP